MNCERCGWEETTDENLIELKVPLTGENWYLCDPCISRVDQWIAGGD